MVRVNPSSSASTIVVQSSNSYYANASAGYATMAQNAANSILTNAGFIAVSQDLTNIDAVAYNLPNINSIVENTSNINAVANDLTNINTVVTNASNISTCSTNIANINTCAANISTISSKVNKSGDTMTGDLYISTFNGGYFFRNPLNIQPYAALTAQSQVDNLSKALLLNITNSTATTSYFGLSSLSSITTAVASSDVKKSITNWAFPSSSYLDLSSTWGASGLTFTTNANGWLLLVVAAGAPNEYIQFNAADGSLDKKSNMLVGSYAPATGYYLYLCMPMSSGQSTKIFYNASGSLFMYGFIYANGG